MQLFNAQYTGCYAEYIFNKWNKTNSLQRLRLFLDVWCWYAVLRLSMRLMPTLSRIYVRLSTGVRTPSSTSASRSRELGRSMGSLHSMASAYVLLFWLATLWTTRSCQRTVTPVRCKRQRISSVGITVSLHVYWCQSTTSTVSSRGRQQVLLPEGTCEGRAAWLPPTSPLSHSPITRGSWEDAARLQEDVWRKSPEENDPRRHSEHKWVPQFDHWGTFSENLVFRV